MADEPLLKDRLEVERRRDDFARLDRINAVEREHAVLKTRFDGVIKAFEEALARAISGADLKELKREMEDKLKAAISDFHGANAQQSQALLSEWKQMLAADRAAQQDEQLKATTALLSAITERRSKVVWWVLGIVGAVITSVVSTLIIVWILGRG